MMCSDREPIDRSKIELQASTCMQAAAAEVGPPLSVAAEDLAIAARLSSR